MPIGKNELRTVMGHFGTGVTVITTFNSEGTLHGLTATTSNFGRSDCPHATTETSAASTIREVFRIRSAYRGTGPRFS